MSPSAYLKGRLRCRTATEKLWPTSRHQKKCKASDKYIFPAVATECSTAISAGTHSVCSEGRHAIAMWKLFSRTALAKTSSEVAMRCRWRAGQGCTAHSDDGQRWRTI